jgi:hypothetical protein
MCHFTYVQTSKQVVIMVQNGQTGCGFPPIVLDIVGRNIRIEKMEYYN